MDAVVLRRTADVNKCFLPPLTAFIVFCRPSPLQARTWSCGLLDATRCGWLPRSHLSCLCCTLSYRSALSGATLCGGAQVQLYEVLLRSSAVSALLTGGSGSVAGGNVLGIITALRKYELFASHSSTVLHPLPSKQAVQPRLAAAGSGGRAHK